MSKKVGIITVHKNVNYGANLQAYASCRFINDLGYDCKVIDYTLPEHDKSNYLYSWLKQSWDSEKNKSFSRKLKLGLALALSSSWKGKRLKAFSKFRAKHVKMTDTCNRIEDVSMLNLQSIVCGSDQIWNPDIMGSINPLFFGEINGVEQRISYAASVGKEKLDHLDEQRAKELIEKIDYCSVREKNTAEYLSELVNKKVQTVCDPVFLLDKEAYSQIAGKQKIKGEYVLLYSVVQNAELTKVAVDYANKRGLKLIEICTAKSNDAKHVQKLSYGPIEFLNAIKYAKTVFTNSFHGTAFSIIFEKDFYVFDNKHRGSRITNVLKLSGLTERLISDKVEKDGTPINYEIVKNNLSEHIAQSKDFLINALKSDKRPTVKNCMGCGVCKTVCPKDAIRVTRNAEGFLKSQIDQSKCVNCGLCEKVCPIANDTSKHKVANNTFAFKAKDELRKNSTSGGAFMALASTVLKENGVVYGAVLSKDFLAKHLRTESIDEATKMQGTKYVQSDITGCFNLLQKDLLDGKNVLFSGTPCQIDAVNHFVQTKKLPKDQLITVDIICHGVPSPKVFKDYISWLSDECKSQTVEFKFRDKNIGWRGNTSSATFAHGKRVQKNKKVDCFIALYYSDNITDTSCYSCKYTTKERVSDLTISDFWGIENVAPEFEDDLGVSMILANTEIGESLLQKTEGQIKAVDVSNAKQPQLIKPTDRPNSRETFWKDYNSEPFKKIAKKYGGVRKDSLKTEIYKIVKKLKGE